MINCILFFHSFQKERLTKHFNNRMYECDFFIQERMCRKCVSLRQIAYHWSGRLQTIVSGPHCLRRCAKHIFQFACWLGVDRSMHNIPFPGTHRQNDLFTSSFLAEITLPTAIEWQIDGSGQKPWRSLFPELKVSKTWLFFVLSNHVNCENLSFSILE